MVEQAGGDERRCRGICGWCRRAPLPQITDVQPNRGQRPGGSAFGAARWCCDWLVPTTKSLLHQTSRQERHGCRTPMDPSVVGPSRLLWVTRIPGNQRAAEPPEILDEKGDQVGTCKLPGELGEMQVEKWSNNGWTMVKQWLNNGWAMVEQWLNNGYTRHNNG